jgi:membrane protein DedA with SNARE-associated domain
MGLTPARLDAAAAVVKKGGPLGIGVAILTPGVRSAAIIACGVAAISLRTFSAGLLIGSVAFLSLHFLIGYLGGPLIASLTQNIPLPLIVAGFVTLLLIGFGVWLMIRRRQQPGASSRTIAVDAFEAFHEASCPVCLTLGAISHIRPATANLPHVHADG